MPPKRWKGRSPNLPKRRENKLAVILIKNDWLYFLKFICCHNDVSFKELMRAWGVIAKLEQPKQSRVPALFNHNDYVYKCQ